MSDSEILPLFGQPEQNIDILSKRIERCSSVNSSDADHIKFLIAGSEEYINLLATTLYYKIRILKANGEDIDDGTDVALINYSAATIFEKVDISLGVANDLVLSHDNYHYSSFLIAQLTFDDHVKNTSLTAGNFYSDTAGKMDALTNENAGFISRKNASAKSTFLECESSINSGFFSQMKPLKNRISLQIEFSKVATEFALMCADGSNFKLEIIEPTLIIERLSLSAKLLNVYESQFLKSPMEYYIERSKFHVKDIDSGLASITLKDFCDSNHLPKRISFAMVSELSYSGKYSLNGFNFKNYNLKSLNLSLNGTCLTGKPMNMDFAGKQYLQPYTQTLKSLGFFGKKDTCSISKEQFANGSTIFVFDIAPTLSTLNLIDPIQSGRIELDLVFAQATPEKFKAVIYSEYEDVFSINHLQRITKSYT